MPGLPEGPRLLRRADGRVLAGRLLDGTRPEQNGKQTAAAGPYGKRIAAAEAFTRNRDPHWMESPALMKPVADKAFCDGFNWFFLGSTATHAGMGTPGDEVDGGTHFNREVTWWPHARPMVDYFARCSYLLQQGLFVADVCYYNGDEAPNFVGPKSVDPALGTGYDYDVCNAEVLLRRMAVRDGRIVLPDGMSYRLLVLPEREGMPVEVVSKLRDLVTAGATVVGPKPQRDTGLKDYPRCDREVQRLADELWGDCDGKTVCQHRFGKGRIVWGIKLRDVLRADGVAPDFEYSAGKESYLDFLHRTAAGAEIYFVANRTAHEETARCTFRTGGKLPELWDPVGGAMRNAANYTIADGRTTLPLMFPPHGSLFVVFRQPAPTARAEGRNFPVFQPLEELSGPWTVHFDPRWGGPETVRFGQLISWTQRPEAGVSSIREPPPIAGDLTCPSCFAPRGRRSISIWARCGTSLKCGSMAGTWAWCGRPLARGHHRRGQAGGQRPRGPHHEPLAEPVDRRCRPARRKARGTHQRAVR